MTAGHRTKARPSVAVCLTAALALSAAIEAQTPEDYATWGGARYFTINTTVTGAAVAGTLTQFPLLVRLTSPLHDDVFAQAAHDGADLRFRRGGGPSLAYEIEHWDPVAKSAAVWVLMDSVRGHDDTQTLAMHWGKPGASGRSAPANVFDSSNGFVAVWHLGHPSGGGPASPHPADRFRKPAACRC